jgi:hypothetical protein
VEFRDGASAVPRRPGRRQSRRLRAPSISSSGGERKQTSGDGWCARPRFRPRHRPEVRLASPSSRSLSLPLRLSLNLFSLPRSASRRCSSPCPTPCDRRPWLGSPQTLTWTVDPDHGACSWMGLSCARLVAGSGAARDTRESRDA